MIFIAAVAIETVAMATFVIATAAMAVLTTATVAMAAVANVNQGELRNYIFVLFKKEKGGKGVAVATVV